MRYMRLECQNKYFPNGSKRRLIRALLCIYRNKTVEDETLLSQSVVYSASALSGPYAGLYAMYGLPLSQSNQKNSFRI